MIAREKFDVVKAPLGGVTLLEASAGTGKTFSIVHLILRLIVEKEIPIDKLLVVTFTKAATAELRARTRSWLIEAKRVLSGQSQEVLIATQLERWRGEGRSDENIQKSIQHSLDVFDEAAIYTIHGFCQQALKSASFSARMPFEQVFLAEQSALLTQVVRDFLRTEMSREHSDAVKTLLLEKSEKDWLDAFQMAVARPTYIANWHIGVGVLLKVSEEIKTEVLEVFTRFLRMAPVQLERFKQEEGLLTYDDMLLNMYRRVSQEGAKDFIDELRRSYQAVLIDEFQDTDPLQYRIFERIFLSGLTDTARRDRTLFFVGDPKQAIYSFRSADLDTYLDARDSVDRVAVLDTNYRSSRAMVEAVNRLFSQVKNPFLRTELAFERVCASGKKEEGLVIAGKSCPALELWSNDEEPGNKESELQKTIDATATDIAKLLSLAQKGEAWIEGRALEARDIAVLVQNNKLVRKVVQALNLRGVRALTAGKDSIFETNEAREMLSIVLAIAQPSDRRRLAGARATRLVGDQLSMFVDDESRRAFCREKFVALRERWLKDGVVAACYQLMRDEAVAQRLLPLMGGERMLTNYYQLIELMYAQSNQRKTPESLALWLSAEISGESVSDDGDHRKLRLESEDNLVTVQTLHSSKGLEYNVVYLPDAFVSDEGKKKTSLFFWHDNEQKPSLQVQFSFFGEDVPEQGRREVREERNRLMYVAMTRAAYRLVLPYCRYKDGRYKKNPFLPSCQNACLRILSGKEEPTENDWFNAWSDIKNEFGNAAEVRQIESIVAQNIRLVPQKIDTELSRFDVRPAKAVFPAWQTTSFTALSRLADIETTNAVDMDQLAHYREDDDADFESLPQTEQNKSLSLLQKDDVLLYPRGALAGESLHALFESVDFESVPRLSDEQLYQQVEKIVRRYYGEMTDIEHFVRAAAKMLRDVLATELLPGLRLQDVNGKSRVSELEFLMSTSLNAPALSALMRSFGEKYDVGRLPDTMLRGFMTGFIDLVFFAQGKYWIVDWKSNYLGDQPQDYDAQALNRAMKTHRYQLQYLIYLVALKRHLETRLPDFDYERDIGGVFYLFIRALRPEADLMMTDDGVKRPYGVVFDRPDRAFIEELDQLLAS